MSNNAQIVRQAMKTIWNDGDISKVEKFYSKNFIADYPLTDWGTGLDGVSALARKVRVELLGYAEEIIELIDAGDDIIVMLAISGRNPATNKTVNFRDVSILSLRNNKIIRQRGVTDLLSLYSQLGVIELDTS